MNTWNELEGSTFFNKVFSQPITIGKVKLFSIAIDNERSNITLEFDIEELPDKPPAKWVKDEFNTCRIGISCENISNTLIKNIPSSEILEISIKQTKNSYLIKAFSQNTLIEFQTTLPYLCGPSVYLDDPDSAYS